MFNVIARNTILQFAAKYPSAANSLFEWYYEMLNASFKDFNELEQVYGSVSLVGDDRVVFNICGNHYRLVVRIVFEYRVIQIKWFGTHKEYDKINVKLIGYKK